MLLFFLKKTLQKLYRSTEAKKKQLSHQYTKKMILKYRKTTDLSHLLKDYQNNEYLLSQKFLRNTQFGFRTSYSTTDDILFCMESFRKLIDTNSSVSCSLLVHSNSNEYIDHKH